MVIKRSSSQEVAALLCDLEHGPGSARDAATARLAVIGTRAVDGLLGVLGRASAPAVRLAALAALEGIGDVRAIEPAFASLEHGEPEVAAAAAGVIGCFLDGDRGTAVLDRLTAIAIDAARADAPRLAAIEALRDVPAAVTAPLWARLRKDPSDRVREAVVAPERPRAAGEDPAEALAAAAEGRLPAPDALRRHLAAAGASAPLPVLHRLVEVVRERERQADGPERAAWKTARAAVHLAIAGHDSTVALYDLRETIESGEPAPVEMLTAIARIGDRSCLEPLASAYARGHADGADIWWREHVLATFQAVAARAGLTARHAEARRIRSRWPDAAPALLSPPRPLTD
ncbi:MAG TPA: hypothetical protein VK911_13575 [Vicinamibacterales bacterium]|nr:hypothetical protein [Vicinamibacterales bacterium]